MTNFGVSVSHNLDGRVHKTSSVHDQESEVEERQAEKKGIYKTVWE